MAVRGKSSEQDAQPGEQPELQPLDSYARGIIRWKAMRLARVAPFTFADIADIEQELTIDLMVRARRFDPTKGTWTTFLGRITDNRVIGLLAKARAKKRGWSHPKFSLNELVRITEEGYAERQEMLEVDGHVELCHDSWRTTDLRIDVETAIAALPPRLRRLCRRLLTQSIQDICLATGTQPAVLRDQTRRIRDLFPLLNSG